MRQWSVSARVEYDTTITVEAETAEEAMQKANDRDWIDAGEAGASLADFHITSRTPTDEGEA